MMLVLVFGGMLGWVVHLAHVQRDAVAAIRSGGGQVTYDWQLKVLPTLTPEAGPRHRSGCSTIWEMTTSAMSNKWSWGRETWTP